MIDVHNFSRSNLPLCESLVVAGTPWLLATNSDSVLRGLHRWKMPSRGSEHFSIRVLVDDRLHRSRATPVYRGMDHVVFATFGSDFFCFDLLRREISGVVCPETASDESFWNRVLLPIAMGVMGCFIGIAPLHSACLEWNGVGVLLAGLSGAGKSTLSAAMAQLGFSFISDDWTYMSCHDGVLAAHGLGIPFKLLPDAARFFGGLPNHELAHSMNGELAYEVDARDFAPHRATIAVPRYLFMLERRSSGASEFQRLDPEFVRDFFEQSSEPFPKVLSHGRKFRSSMIERIAGLHCWRFCYSGSPHDAAACIRKFIEQ